MTIQKRIALYPEDFPIIVSAFCGYYVGPPKWQPGLSDWEFEPDDCDTEFAIQSTLYSWLAGHVPVICPSCGAEFQPEDYEAGSVWLGPDENPRLKYLPPYGELYIGVHGVKGELLPPDSQGADSQRLQHCIR